MDMDSQMILEQPSGRRKGRVVNKHYWTDEEDNALVSSLQELLTNTHWRCDNDFRNGYMYEVERMMKQKLPHTTLKAFPNIDSKLRSLKIKHNLLSELLQKSGFSFNYETMTLQCERAAFNEWAKGRKDVDGLYGKPFVHYPALVEIFGKECATESFASNAYDDETTIRLEDTYSVHEDFVDMDNHEEVFYDNCSNREGDDQVHSQPQVQSENTGFTIPDERSNSRKRKGSGSHEMRQMTIAIMKVVPKLDGLIDVLSNDREVARMQEKMEEELRKITCITQGQRFRVANMLCKSHDLLRYFFTLADDVKPTYVLDVLENGV